MPGICWIRRNALDDLLAEARRWPVRETGGALLGHRKDELAVIETVIGPGPGAVHGFSYFEPDAEWQQAQGEQIYVESGRTIVYLGDWHSHPRGSAVPSGTDRETAKMISSEKAFRAPRPLYGIASKRFYQVRQSSWLLRMMEYVDNELAEVQLVVLDESKRREAP